MNPTLAAMFPNASKSCRDANTDVPATSGRPVKKTSSTGILESPPPYSAKMLMNKTESSFAQRLEIMKLKGEILRYDYQGLTLRWQSGNDIIRYTADFVVSLPDLMVEGYRVPQLVKLIEVKGGYSKMPGYLERAVERFRHARTFWPQFQFELHKKTKEGWKKIL